MELLERLAEATEAQRESGDSLEPPRDTKVMKSRTHCAYNQTRECFLGLEVKAADLESARVGELISARPLKSGEGVWMTPFRGIPADAMVAPLDLIYLDENCRVIDTVESFPTFQVSASGPQPKSVLALPAHSIYSSQTQSGDQLVLCVAEEMGRQLQRLNNSRNEAGVVPPTIAGAVLLREKPLWSGGPGVLELENRDRRPETPAQPTYEMDLTQPGADTVQAAAQLVQALVVARSAQGSARAGAGTGRLLLERNVSGGARHSRHQLHGPVRGDRRALVSRNPGSDDPAKGRSGRRGYRALDCRAVAGGALGTGWRGAAVCLVR